MREREPDALLSERQLVGDGLGWLARRDRMILVGEEAKEVKGSRVQGGCMPASWVWCANDESMCVRRERWCPAGSRGGCNVQNYQRVVRGRDGLGGHGGGGGGVQLLPQA